MTFLVTCPICPLMPSIKSGFCWICNGTFNCGLRMARDRLVTLRWTGNDWKLFGHVFDFIVVGCGGVKCGGDIGFDSVVALTEKCWEERVVMHFEPTIKSKIQVQLLPPCLPNSSTIKS